MSLTKFTSPVFSFFFLLAIALLSASVNAAIVKGTVFDTNLDPTTAIVSVNTTPSQVMVAKNGFFSFEVPRGFFLLKASSTSGNYSTFETVRVESEAGIFNVDLILFGFEEPSLEIPSVAPPGTGFEGQETNVPDNGGAGIFFGLVAAALIIVAGFLWHRSNKTPSEIKSSASGNLTIPSRFFASSPPQEEKEKNEDSKTSEEIGDGNDSKGVNEFQKRILDELRKSEGRMNQKELRKLLPWSEAKVSIELDLLEEKGLIKKFKKGRGNIIILVEKSEQKRGNG